MHPYFKHLLEDIYEANCVQQAAENPYNKAFKEETDEVEDDLNEHAFGYYCGLQPENFPPPEQLSTKEVEVINGAFKHMLFTYNHGISLPEHLPAKTAYSILVNTLNEQTFIPRDGIVSFDYCSGYPPDCVFKEHCSCLNIWNSLPEKDAGMCHAERI
jgi:hypothetical protein